MHLGGTAQRKAAPPPSNPRAQRPLEFCGTTWVSTAGWGSSTGLGFLPYTMNKFTYQFSLYF